MIMPEKEMRAVWINGYYEERSEEQKKDRHYTCMSSGATLRRHDLGNNT